MSISLYCRIKQKCVDGDTLEKLIKEFYSCEAGITREKYDKCELYEGMDKDNTIINFIVETRFPYDLYEFNNGTGEFAYTQVIIFDLGRDVDYTEKYKEIINFCFFIAEKVQGEILITSDAHNEICVLSNQEKTWYNDFFESIYN